MGWFSKKKTCDWCGKTFTGDGLADGDLVLCGQACLDEKTAPPIPAAAPAPPKMTPAVVDSELQAALSGFEECKRDFQAWTVAPDEERRQELASKILAGESSAWGHLGEAARGLQQLRVDSSAFDGLLQQYTAREKPVVTSMRFPGYQAEFEAAAKLVESLLAGIKGS